MPPLEICRPGPGRKYGYGHVYKEDSRTWIQRHWPPQCVAVCRDWRQT